MAEQRETVAEASSVETESAAADVSIDQEDGGAFVGAASFADAESREILNLLADGSAGGSCCGGSCCAG